MESLSGLSSGTGIAEEANMPKGLTRPRGSEELCGILLKCELESPLGNPHAEAYRPGEAALPCVFAYDVLFGNHGGWECLR